MYNTTKGVTGMGQMFIHAHVGRWNTGADPGFGQGGAPGAEAESCRHSEGELHERSKQFVAGVQGP